MTDDIKTIEPLAMVPIVEDPTLITIKVIKGKFVDQMQQFERVPEKDPRFPNVKIVGRVGSHTVIFRFFNDADPTNYYMGQIGFLNYIHQLTEQLVAASEQGRTPEIINAARDQAQAYFYDMIPELFTS